MTGNMGRETGICAVILMLKCLMGDELSRDNMLDDWSVITLTKGWMPNISSGSKSWCSTRFSKSTLFTFVKNYMMNKHKIIKITSAVFIIFSACSLLMVSLMAIANPQSVMDLVQVKLPNNDAYSSIRGIYGGVGLVIITQLVYLLIKDSRTALAFLAMFWGAYALSRLITIAAEGTLGAFGNQWLMIESIFSVTALILYNLHPGKVMKRKAGMMGL